MNKILVTGAFGFLGQWLVKELLNNGNEVIVMSHENLKTVNDWNFQDVYVEHGDIRNYLFIDRLIKKHKPNIIFHLAAQAIVSKALDNPYETMQTNVSGTTNLLECARNSDNVDKIIVASSDKAYGNEKSPYDENTPLNGRFPYDCSKSCTDLVSQCYRDTYNMPISIVRCGNIFGGGDFNWNRVFPEAIKSCYEKRPMNIRSDGKSMFRDYIYVEDVVSAYIFISKLINNETVNISYGRERNVLDVLNSVQEETNVFISPNIQNYAKCEIDIQCLNSDYIKSLGWKSKYNFDYGVNKAVNWYYKYFNRGEIV